MQNEKQYVKVDLFTFTMMVISICLLTLTTGLLTYHCYLLKKENDTLTIDLQQNTVETLKTLDWTNAVVAKAKRLQEELTVKEAYIETLPGHRKIKINNRLPLVNEVNCLTMGLFLEEGMGGRTDLLKIANVLYNRVSSTRYPDDICGVLKEGRGTQFSSMRPYIAELTAIRNSQLAGFIPKFVQRDMVNLKKWKFVESLSYEILETGLPYYTDATHFISFTDLKHIPTFARKYRLSGNTTGHVLFTDHEYRDGKLYHYTHERPFNQAVFTHVANTVSF